jgi:hypothetical protein
MTPTEQLILDLRHWLREHDSIRLSPQLFSSPAFVLDLTYQLSLGQPSTLALTGAQTASAAPLFVRPVECVVGRRQLRL